MQAISWQQQDFIISTDKTLLDIATVHQFLNQESNWAKGIPMHRVKTSIQHSLCFGIYQFSSEHRSQIGFCRVLTDYAVFGYLADVFVLPQWRGRGLSKWMMDCVMSHPELQHLRRFMLTSSDARPLYAKFGFMPLAAPEKMMEIVNPDTYKE